MVQIIKAGDPEEVLTPEPPPEQSGLNGTGYVPRRGWEEHSQRMAENGEDVLLDGDIPSMTKWDETEWDW